MARNHHSIGNAGEFYVLAQRGYIAGKTDYGQTVLPHCHAISVAKPASGAQPMSYFCKLGAQCLHYPNLASHPKIPADAIAEAMRLNADDFVP